MTDFNCMLAKLQKTCLNTFQGQFEKQTYVRVALTLKIEKALAKSLIRQLTELGLLEHTADDMVYQPTAAGRLIQFKQISDDTDQLRLKVMQSILENTKQTASAPFVANKLGRISKDDVSYQMARMAEQGQLVRYSNGSYRVSKEWRNKLMLQSAGGAQ